MRILLLLLALTPLRAGEIALSFDDAPRSDSAVMTGEQRGTLLIEALREAGVARTVFFCTTHSLGKPERRQRLERYAAAGHLLANHTDNHRRIDQIGVAAYIEDIRTADRKLRDMKGFRPWFRYPFLDQGRDHETRDRIIAALDAMDYQHGYVTVDNYDWYLNHQFVTAVAEGKTVDREKLRDAYVSLLWESIQFYDRVGRETLGRSPKHVLLLHENELAALFLTDLVAHLKANGWTIIDPETAYADPISRERPRVLMGQGRVAAIARANGYSGRLSHVHEDTEWLDRYVLEQGIIAP